MAESTSVVLPVVVESDIVKVRQAVRTMALAIKCSLVDQTKVVTAASELARNLLIHGGGGEVRLELIEDGMRSGLRAVFEDRGRGIPDIAVALRDGYTTGTGMGLGLGGAKRLVSDFAIESAPDKGTRVTITKWR